MSDEWTGAIAAAATLGTQAALDARLGWFVGIGFYSLKTGPFQRAPDLAYSRRPDPNGINLARAGRCRTLAVLVVVAILTGSACTAAYAQECLIAPGGLTHWWPGDGNGTDLRGSQHAVPSGGVSFAAGRVGQAFRFNGTGGWLDHGNVGNFGTSEFTIAFWIRTTLGSFQALMGKRSICAPDSFIDVRMRPPRPLVLELSQDANSTNYISVVPSSSLHDGVWHHIALTRAATTASVFVDGILEATGTTPGVTNIVNAAPWRSGWSACIGVDGTNYFEGDLDEIMFFDRSLSPCEIDRLASAGAAGVCKGDRDLDGVPDIDDACPADFDPGQTDTDADGAGDICDCAPMDPTLSRPAGEVHGLVLGPETDHLAWCSIGLEAGSDTVYDVCRGSLDELPAGTGLHESCVASLLPLSETSDLEEPPAGQGFWYLVRGRNSCGTGSYGSSTSGVERLTDACP